MGTDIPTQLWGLKAGILSGPGIQQINSSHTHKVWMATLPHTTFSPTPHLGSGGVSMGSVPVMTVRHDCTHLSTQRSVQCFLSMVPKRTHRPLITKVGKVTLFQLSCGPGRGQCGGRHYCDARAPLWGRDLT